ncbi:UNVERIFIED_CONTAM: hypothetical protein Sindi_3032800, partial [Sesamum indicum]
MGSKCFPRGLEDLKDGLDNVTYINVILQLLPPSYDPFIINYNMNGLEKSSHELINMLVQYEPSIHKFVPSVLIGETLTSNAKGKKAESWKRKKGKGKVQAPLLLQCKRNKGKGRTAVHNDQGKMMFPFI